MLRGPDIALWTVGPPLYRAMAHGELVHLQCQGILAVSEGPDGSYMLNIRRHLTGTPLTVVMTVQYWTMVPRWE